eukprot:scaffold4110_cov77-Skeletonema_dohrnii-CCMP3373.AAC.5
MQAFTTFIVYHLLWQKWVGEQHQHSAPTLLQSQSPLSVPLFPPSSNGSTLTLFPNKNNKCGWDNNRSFSSDGSNVPPVFYEERWDMRYQELVAYKDEHGDTLVPQNYPDNPLLGKWVTNRRNNRKNNKLTKERIDKLNEIGFVWDVREAAWENMLQQLKQYKDERGDTLVPQNYPDNPQLGIWVTNQRAQYKRKLRGQSTQMTDERVDKLDEIGFVWDPFDYAWNEMLQQLMKYKEVHGDTLVPQSYAENQQLAIWVDTQRQKRKNNKMAPERVNKLNDMGFVWEPYEAAWEERLKELVEYKNEHGDTLVPARYKDNPKLGKWVDKQRVQYQYKLKQRGEASQLNDEREYKLNEIGFVWDPYEAAWGETFQQLMEYKDEHGDTLVPYKYKDNPQLGVWVSNQRSNGKNNSLTQERIDKLNEIDFVWDAIEAAWQTKYKKLNTFYKRYGHTRIHFAYEKQDHNELYYWCMRQRYSKAKGQLKGHRYDQLKKINFDFFFRKIAKGSSLIENMIIYELERMGHEFDMLNQVFFGVRLFPDGVIFVDEVFAIFLEVDEKYHSCRSSYPIKRELGRMNTLCKEAAMQGYDQVIFVRIGTGDQRKVVESQIEFVSKHLHELKSKTGANEMCRDRIRLQAFRNFERNFIEFECRATLRPRTRILSLHISFAPVLSNVQPNRYSVHYIDYPDDHHHVIASREHFDEVKVLTSN